MFSCCEVQCHTPGRISCMRSPSMDGLSANRLSYAIMRTYLRLLRYLRPHAGPLALALMVAYALVDGFSIVILVPFLQVLFGGPSEAVVPLPAGAGLLDRAEHFFRHDLWSWLAEPTPLETLSNVCLLILGIYFVKAILGYFKQYLPQIVLERT